MDWIAEPQAWIALLTLTVLEIVLGIDNIIFISILSGKLPPGQRHKARTLGLAMAMIMRILLLASIAWVVQLEATLVTIFGNELSGRDLILLVGGLFLLGKATHEIHHKLEGVAGEKSAQVAAAFGAVIFQITVLDMVFSLDSVITAVGMADELAIMVLAVVIAIGFMIVFARSISEFVERHPTVKMLALAFLLLIGMALVADGLDHHIPKGYIYFAMGFSVFVEALNLRMRSKRRTAPVDLREPYVES